LPNCGTNLVYLNAYLNHSTTPNLRTRIALRLPHMASRVEVWCAWVMELDAITAELPAEPESAHTSSRKGARNPRIELITRGERRRRWTIEQKQTIAAQSLAPGASPTEVARQYGISSGQLYTWRHALLAAQPEAVMHTAGRFARVELKATRTLECVSQEAAIEAPAVVPELPVSPTAQPSGRIEIVLADGTAVRMDTQVDELALRRVLAVLRG
jgi:transposase